MRSKITKRILALCLSLLIVFLCACSAQNPSGSSQPQPSADSSAGSETPSGDEPAPSEQNSSASSEDLAPSENSGETPEPSADYIYEADTDGKIVLLKYTGSDSDPVTPQTVGGKEVSAIGNGCFQGLVCVKSVTVSEGVETIGDYAFECCSYLEKASLPSSLKTIGEGAFSGCINLTSVDIASVESIGRGAFLYAKQLVAVSFPANLRTIGEFAFSNCASLAEVDFGEAEITVLPDRVFYECSKLESVSLPKNLTSVGKRTFSGCTSLQSLVFPNETEIGEYVFEDCTALCDLTLRTRSIPKGCFSGCSSLSSVSLEDVGELGERAFAGTRIAVLEIPDSVQKIEGGVFFNSNISSVTLSEGSPFEIVDGALLGDGGKTMIAYLGEETEEYTIPNGVETLASHAFATAQVSKVILPDSVVKIGSYAFRYSYVMELEMSEGVSLDPDAFRESGLETYEDGDDSTPYEELRIDEIGSYAKEKSLFDETEFQNYLVISNEEFDAWSERYLAFCEESGCPLNYDTMTYTMLYKGEVIPHYLGMTCVQNHDPDMWKEAENAFGDDFEQTYLMMDHGLFTELRRGKMNDDLVLYTGVYDSQLMAAAKTDSVPTMDQLIDAIGSEFTDPIMTSTTTDPQIAANFGNTLFIIYASKEAVSELGAICIDAVAHSRENEILLCENAKYEILDVGAFEIGTLDRYYVSLRLLGKGE